jgi:hypothetical protein
MPTFTSFSSILLVMATLSNRNPAMNTPFPREDTSLVDIVTIEDEGFKFEELPEEETPGEEIEDEDIWDEQILKK